jgi:hypothetical protein
MDSKPMGSNHSRPGELGNDPVAHRIADRIRQSSKYAGLEGQFVERVVVEALKRQANESAAIKAAKAKLHQAVGAFSGPNPLKAGRKAGLALDEDRGAGERPNLATLRLLMKSHASTAEREPHLDDLQAMLGEWCGPVESISDYGCGLGAAAIPWLGLEPGGRYWCCDVDERLLSMARSVTQDMASSCRAVPLDLAGKELDPSRFETSELSLVLKLVTTLDRQRPGAGERLMAAIPGDQVVMSLPIRSLGGRRSYAEPRPEVDRLAAATGFVVRAERTLGPEFYAHLVR